MAEISKTDASLRIFGNDLIPDEVTALLGKKPDAANRNGETVRTPSGVERIARRGRWINNVDRRAPGDLDGQIAELLSGTTEDMAVWQRLTSGFDVDLFCGLFMEEWNEGLTLSASSLQQLGERGIKLDLDIYAAGDPPDDGGSNQWFSAEIIR